AKRRSRGCWPTRACATSRGSSRFLALTTRAPTRRTWPRSSVWPALPASVQRLLQVREQILFFFDAHRQTDQAVVDANLGAPLGGQTGVGHQRRQLDQALDAAQRFGEREQTRAPRDL